MEEKKIRVSRACRVIGIDRKTYHYQLKKRSDDSLIRKLLKELSELHPRYGFKKSK